MSRIEYFAYGSNMDLERIKKRIGWAPSMRPAFLENYQLLFDKLSNDGGKANIRPHAGSIVEGVLYLLEEKDLLELDHFEGVANGHYSRDSIEVMTESEGLCRVITYIAQKTGPEIPPTRAYLDHLLAGRDLLSPKYLKNLEKLQTLD